MGVTFFVLLACVSSSVSDLNADPDTLIDLNVDPVPTIYLTADPPIDHKANPNLAPDHSGGKKYISPFPFLQFQSFISLF